MTDKASLEYKAKLEASRKAWDNEAPTFDNEADHGLRQHHVRQAWKTLLYETISLPKNAKALDIGCGTGSLSLLLSEAGYNVTSIDLSPAMIEKAKEKASEGKHKITFHMMDAAYPEFEADQFDLILCRHLLWALDEPQEVLVRWINLLKPGGFLVLIEGFWHTGAGLHATQIQDMMPATMTNITVKSLSEQSDLWGTNVEDERYLISARLNSKN